jgi:Major Facilitator Superfamily
LNSQAHLPADAVEVYSSSVCPRLFLTGQSFKAFVHITANPHSSNSVLVIFVDWLLCLTMTVTSEKVEGAKMPEKQEESEFEVIESSSNSRELGYDEKQTKKLVRKIDWSLLPFLALLYLLSFLDRTNIGNARLANLEKDLGMSGLDYNVALAVLFPFYVAAEIPSNTMMKRTRPSLWIPTIMLAWAVCCTLMGLVSSFGGLIAARAALGVAEGGLFPGVTVSVAHEATKGHLTI